MWITGLRRVGFVLALLAVGAVTVGCFHWSFNSSWARIANKSPWVTAFGTFAWGADSLGLVVGAWLAARYQVWQTWSGRWRALIYVLAYGYGRMLFSATQDWLHQIGPDGRSVPVDSTPIPFRWPGGDWQDFARPSLDLLTLLALVWLLVPMFVMVRGELGEARDRIQTRPTFSISFLFTWTTISAVILLWIRFLTWNVAPETSFSHMAPTTALTEFLTEQMPSETIGAIAVIVLVWSWSGRWWQPLAGLAAALLIDSLGHKLLYLILDWATGSKGSRGVLSGPLLEHCSYIAGRNFVVWAAFGMAALTGLRLRWPAIGAPMQQQNRMIAAVVPKQA